MKEAEQVYTRVLELSDWAGYFRNRVEFYIFQGRYEEAKADLAKAAEKEPWHPYTFGRKGQLALAQGRFEEAAEAFEEASRRDPHSVMWQFGLALALLGMERHSSFAIPYSLLELHEQVEEAERMLGLLERARPGLAEAQRARERLLKRRALLDRLAKEECARYLTPP